MRQDPLLMCVLGGSFLLFLGPSNSHPRRSQCIRERVCDKQGVKHAPNTSASLNGRADADFFRGPHRRAEREQVMTPQSGPCLLRFERFSSRRPGRSLAVGLPA